MKKIIELALFIILFISMAAQVQAEKLFTVEATVDGTTVTTSYEKLEDLVEVMDNEGLRSLADNYTETSAANVILNVRGLAAYANYDANSTTLTFSIPELNINKTFTGATRDSSQDLLENYLKKNGDGILTDMLSYLAGQTPTDPVAGNPGSLMSQMGGADFNNGTDLGGGNSIQAMRSSQNSFGIGLRFGNYSTSDYDQQVYCLPLTYTYRFNSDPQKRILFDLPIVYSDVEGSRAYSTSLGMGFRLPVTREWGLTPGVRIGALGSIDMGSAAIIYSASLTSNYNLRWKNYIFTMGNMFAYYTTESINAGDYEIDYDLTNTMLKNGLGVEGPLRMKLWGKPTSWQFSVANTAFSGDELYIDNYFDFSLSFGTRATKGLWNYLRMGVTYTYCDEYDGFQINFGYSF